MAVWHMTCLKGDQHNILTQLTCHTHHVHETYEWSVYHRYWKILWYCYKRMANISHLFGTKIKYEVFSTVQG